MSPLPGRAALKRPAKAAWHAWGALVTRAFSRYFYARADLTWGRTSWLGVPLSKNPLDLWVYQEILWEVRPALVVETGTYRGGSALFIASILDLVGKGRVVTIDISVEKDRVRHPRIEYVHGSSVAPETVALVARRAADAGGPVLVVLDSDHHAPHVRAELDAYHRFVTPGSYLIVEDTNVNGHPVWRSFGPGPMEAVAAFLPMHPEFSVDACGSATWSPTIPAGTCAGGRDGLAAGVARRSADVVARTGEPGEARVTDSTTGHRLAGKTALVTGAGRPRGLGFAIATRLSAEGARVVLTDLAARAGELEEGAARIRARSGEAVALTADITAEAEVDALFARALEATGRLDVLVNNAGVIVTKLVVDTSLAEWRRCVDVMGAGTFLCSRRTVEIMARQGTGGRIINISSISGKRGNPYFGAYTFAKFGIIGLTETLAREVAHLGITVNAVCPGTVETDMIDEVRRDRAVHGRPEVPAWAEPIPLGRLASAEDVAAVVAFLASADAGYLTGQAIAVDGGRVTG